MRRVLLAPVAIFAGLVACQEITTSPQVASPDVRMDSHDGVESFPPPPGSDTGAVANSPDAGFFSLNVTYFLNKPETSGFISFQKEQPEGVTIDPNARVRFSQGTFSGNGLVLVQTASGLLTLDLANVGDGSVFTACDAPVDVGPGTSDVAREVEPPSVSCFRLVIENGTFTPTGGSTRPAADVVFTPCVPRGGICQRTAVDVPPAS